MLLQKPLLIRFSIQLLISWSILSAALFIWGKPIISGLIPYFTLISDIFAPSYSAELKIISSEQDDLIQLTAYVVKKIVLGSGKTIFPGAKMTAGINLIHSLVPIVILYSLLFSWPVKSWISRGILLLLGLPMIVIILGLTTPLLLEGKLEMMLMEESAKVGIERTEPFLLTWMIFIESGGRWLLPLAAAILCIYLVNKFSVRI